MCFMIITSCIFVYVYGISGLFFLSNADVIHRIISRVCQRTDVGDDDDGKFERGHIYTYIS